MTATLLFLSITGVAAAPGALGPTVTLRGGVEMPSVGSGSMGSCGPDSFGTVGNVPCKGMNATLEYFALGGRSVHDALSYCNQYGLGQAAKQSKIARKDLFLMSMVPYHLLGYNNTIAAVEASLAQMELDYLDLARARPQHPLYFLVNSREGDAALTVDSVLRASWMNSRGLLLDQLTLMLTAFFLMTSRDEDISGWPRTVCAMKAFPNQPSPPNSTSKSLWEPPQCSVDDPTWETCQDGSWEALLSLKKAGKIRAIGVSNWRIANLQRWKDKGYELPAVNQVEAHVGYVEDDLNDFCKQNGILVQAATPLSRSNPVLVVPGTDPTITAIAKKYNKSCAQVSLRYLLEKGISPIPSSTNPAYMQENLNIHDFELTAAEVLELAKLNPTCRGEWFMGLQKCWADPGTLMCMSSDGKRFHCP